MYLAKGESNGQHRIIKDCYQYPETLRNEVSDYRSVGSCETSSRLYMLLLSPFLAPETLQ